MSDHLLRKPVCDTSLQLLAQKLGGSTFGHFRNLFSPQKGTPHKCQHIPLSLAGSPPPLGASAQPPTVMGMEVSHSHACSRCAHRVHILLMFPPFSPLLDTPCYPYLTQSFPHWGFGAGQGLITFREDSHDHLYSLYSGHISVQKPPRAVYYHNPKPMSMLL
jgi:hypothetical protein